MDKVLKISIFTIIIFSQNIKAQSALRNFGNIQIHNEGKMGFHIDLINSGTFDNNLGLTGFYNSDNSLKISGNQTPRFHDMEVDVVNHLKLEVNTEVVNDLNFINGDIITPRSMPSIALNFLPLSLYDFENDLRNTDGYASYNGNLDFSFPIGQDNKLRPLTIPLQTGNPKFKAAYFNEDANFPSTFGIDFDTTKSEVIIKAVSVNEFWDFDGNKETKVTLTWDQESNISDLVKELLNLRVVGWHIEEKQWKDLGNTNFTGSITSGTITSIFFKPNDYEVITFGSLIGSEDVLVYNLFSPNNDGINDVFVIEGINLFSNRLEVYNRWGNLVYKRTNYQNDWNGIAEVSLVITKGEKLPSGTYYYVLNLPESNTNKIGWLYINY